MGYYRALLRSYLCPQETNTLRHLNHSPHPIRDIRPISATLLPRHAPRNADRFNDSTIQRSASTHLANSHSKSASRFR
jgi:hypothetical protein